MKKRYATTFTLLSLLLIGGYVYSDRCFAHGKPSIGKENSQKIKISLLPKISSYTINEVAKGAVHFSAIIENNDDRSTTIAHPIICFPADYQIGMSFNFKDHHGKSEILLFIKNPDDQLVLLRDGPHFFDPGNLSHFNLRPGESAVFNIGWFFLNARGRWEDDQKAASVFMKKGKYKVMLLFRNTFPKSFVYDASTGKSGPINAWTGEIQSNKVVVNVK